MTDSTRLWVAGGAVALAATLGAATFLAPRDGPAALSPRPIEAMPVEAMPAAAERPPAESPRLPAPAAPIRAAPPRAAVADAPPERPAAVGAPAGPPRFDVVRMGARGSVVVAGRAAPGAEVLLHEGGREIGRARADARGEWVILPAEPIGPGARELSLRARLAGGEEMAGPDTVVVVGPAPAGSVAGAGPDPAPAAAAGPAPDGTPLVLLLPPTAAAAPRPLLAPARGGEAPVLGLDVVDYDDGDAMRFAGSAPPGARLRLYADDRPLGDAEADPAGRWSLVPAETPAAGRHTLRVDQLGREGAAVTGRIEVPFQREALPPGALRDGRVVVQPGNNLWRIARDTYGQGIRYTVIYRANQAQIRHPARIYPGQRLAVP